MLTYFILNPGNWKDSIPNCEVREGMKDYSGHIVTIRKGCDGYENEQGMINEYFQKPHSDPSLISKFPGKGKDSIPNCEFKEEIKDLKQKMSTMKKELMKEIRVPQSKNCRKTRRGYYGNYRNNKNY